MSQESQIDREWVLSICASAIFLIAAALPPMPPLTPAQSNTLAHFKPSTNPVPPITNAGIVSFNTENTNDIFILWQSSNLLQWVPIATNHGTRTSWLYTNPPTTNVPQRFWKVEAIP